MNDEKNSINTQLEESPPKSAPSDDRFADPQTDIDPRTSDEGMTSVGASDLNADTATQSKDSDDAVPGVRSS